jgi:hypothetical protein
VNSSQASVSTLSLAPASARVWQVWPLVSQAQAWASVPLSALRPSQVAQQVLAQAGQLQLRPFLSSFLQLWEPVRQQLPEQLSLPVHVVVAAEGVAAEAPAVSRTSGSQSANAACHQAKA